MSTHAPLIAAWARSAVVARDGAFKALHAHDIAAPVVQALLQRAGVEASQVNAVVLGNALGAGGNPARMLALHAGLPEACAALTVDTQCCAGLDAIAMGVALIASGQAEVVVAGGVEAWSRAPIRMHRPLHTDEAAVAYERPAFAPHPDKDPDMLLSAARYAAHSGYTRAQQEAYAQQSHSRAVMGEPHIAQEIVAVAGVVHDSYPRHIDSHRAARMPVVARSDAAAGDPPDACALSALTISAQADGAAFVLLLSPKAAARLNHHAKATWVSNASIGAAPEFPLLAAELAAREALKRANFTHANAMGFIELHDAFAVQGLSFTERLGVTPECLNPLGGGLARGHPIGASAAIALVRLLANLERHNTSGAHGLAAVAGAGGLGSAAVVRWL
ncbi:acetyl-CoA acetyltransferase [Limnohabitans curvus]|uniref:Acetyl-CoA acetyltransferase n=1 Tax=Limnohabitans curvus TaxID=323423 RepID=A0A315ESE8_9BURK|nr:thiolase family protein [Limnohabitans curvus]PUE59715.1 acetyl-CoA acetyltransferase [Limnohabitans curvus]